MSPDDDMIRWGHERVRLAPWHGEQGVTLLTPLLDGPTPSATFIRHCLDTLAERGIERVMTGALGPADMEPFVHNGFDVAEELHLMTHDLGFIPDVHLPDDVVLRRGRPKDHNYLLHLDQLAFEDFWQLDKLGFDDALRATSSVRLRMATTSRGHHRRVLGYAITGRSARTGYLQRLAVDPKQQGRGVGAALVADAMHWLQWWRCHHLLLNTQFGNETALHLYHRLGFHRLPERLAVLTRGLGRPVCP